MTEDNTSRDTIQLSLQRLNELIERHAAQGVTQQQIAAKLGLAPQYLSDLVRGRRTMNELVARRLEEQFGVSYRWLLGKGDHGAVQNLGSGFLAQSIWLPLLPHPIEGEPRAHSAWEGACVELSGFVVGRLRTARLPYVLRFNHDDVQGRLTAGDLLLVSQTANPSAKIQIVKFGKKLFLARSAKGDWQRVALTRGKSQHLPPDLPILGHALAIVWGSLV